MSEHDRPLRRADLDPDPLQNVGGAVDREMRFLGGVDGELRAAPAAVHAHVRVGVVAGELERRDGVSGNLERVACLLAPMQVVAAASRGVSQLSRMPAG